MAMAVTRFRLGELTEIHLGDLPMQVRDVQPHRAHLGELDWLQMQEAQISLGRKTTVVPHTQITPGREPA
jgi:hypothetical protein